MPTEACTAILRGCGMSPGEITYCDLEPIHQIPVNPNGFGLIGKTGIGKTAVLAKCLFHNAEQYASQGRLAPFAFARWENWPSLAEELKMLSRGHDQMALEGRLDWLERTHALYLDDLGQERIKGDDDLALGYLRVLLDTRHRYNKPVFWSTNLEPETLSETYGARTISRMIQSWPPIRLTGEDLRLKKVMR